MALEVFISHSHKDRRIARALVRFLITAVGLREPEIRCTSYPPTGLPAGKNFEKGHRKDIENCNYFLLLLTSNTRDSEFVSFEIGAAWILEKHVWPLVYAKRKRPKIPSVLDHVLYVDLKSRSSLVKFARDLAKEIWVREDVPTEEQVIPLAQFFLADIR